LGKDVSLTGRTEIWRLSFQYIIKKPFFGYGVEPIDIVESKIVGGHSHNITLWVLYQGGILGFSVFAIFFLRFFFDLKQSWLANSKSEIIGILLFCFFLSWEVDNCDALSFYFCAYLMYCCTKGPKYYVCRQTEKAF
jgi:O-antigen ligase